MIRFFVRQFAIKKLPALIIFLLPAILLVACGTAGESGQPISTRGTIILTLIAFAILSLIFIGVVKGAFRLLLLVAFLALVTSLLFYWRATKFPSELTEIQIWANGLDVALAHVVVSLGLIVALALILLLPLIILISVTGGLSSNESRAGCLPAVILLLYVGGIIFSYKFLMVDTIDLQMIVFNDFDRTLGWNFPTTFRFSNFVSQVNQLYGTLSGDPEIQPVFGSVSAAITFVLTVGGVLGVAQGIRGLFKG